MQGSLSQAAEAGGAAGMEVPAQFTGKQQSADYQVLIHAISSCSGIAVQQLIKLDPGLVHIHGWNGHTVLHKACLTGDLNIVTLLLEAGADPNAINDFNETPVNYASKRGIPSIVHLLVVHGGKLDTVDKRGRTVMHDAAQTGSVYMMQYLAEQGIQFSVLDEELQTPLHIVCAFGHLEAFKYLTKKRRCEPGLADGAGNTPLHLCCREGYGHGSWLLVNFLGLGALHVKNKSGHTPVDLCRQNGKLGNQELLPVLEAWEKQPVRQKPLGPATSWYWNLLMPALIYSLAILVSFLLPGYQTLIFLLAVAYIIVNVRKSSHRLPHCSRMANPLQAGLFAAGMLHTMLVYYLHVSLYLSDYTLLVCVSTLVNACQLYLYVKLLRVDPGQVRSSALDKQTSMPVTVTDLCTPGRKLELYCVACEITRKESTKHCKICDKCYYKMDHHCLFLLKCIANNNHARFIWFIMVTVFIMVVFLLEVYLYTTVRFPQLLYGALISHMFWYDGWVFSMCLLNIGSLVWGGVLLKVQLTVISKGQTTYFQTSVCTLTTTQRVLNVIYFLQGKPLFAKDFIFDMPGVKTDQNHMEAGHGHSHNV